MLVEFRITNYRSIHKEQVFSLVASKDAKHPDNLIPCEGFRLLKSAALYGANASGKSNLIKALRFMKQLVLESATRMNEGDKIQGAVPFLLSAETQRLPCQLEVTLIQEGISCRYGFSATQERVYGEWLSSFLSDYSEQVWFKRSFDNEAETANWVFDGPLQPYGDLLQERTRDNSLVLSTGPRENIQPLKQIFQWFRTKLQTFDLSGPPDDLKQQTTDACMQNEEFKQRLRKMLEDADVQIDDFLIPQHDATRHNTNGHNHESGSKALIEWFENEYDHPKNSQVRMMHKMIDSADIVPFNLEEESNGTQRLFALAAPLLTALDQGSVVFIDELDCSIHPLLTRKLIELFQSPIGNSKGAQLVFATHDSTLLDPELLRRDQIYLAEKARNRGSEYFSLYDFDTKDRPRNTEAFQKNYLSGRYGGVPQFGATFEDL